VIKNLDKLVNPRKINKTIRFFNKILVNAKKTVKINNNNNNKMKQITLNRNNRKKKIKIR
jgi:hypothetical protein